MGNQSIDEMVSMFVRGGKGSADVGWLVRKSEGGEGAHGTGVMYWNWIVKCGRKG